MNSRLIKSRLLLGIAPLPIATTRYYAFQPDSSFLESASEYLRCKFRKFDDRHSNSIIYSVIFGSAYGTMFGSAYGTMIGHLIKNKFLSQSLITQCSLFAVFAVSSLAFQRYCLDVAYYRFITSPVGVVKERKFSQRCTKWNIALRYGIPERIKGVCYGVTTVWGEYESNGNGVLSQLKGPWIKNTLLLDKINSIQGRKIAVSGDGYALALHPNPDAMKQFEETLNVVTTEAVDEAVKHPGQLYGLFICNSKSRSGNRTSHVIGVRVSMEDDKQVIKYFDSNFREATFHDKEYAQKSLALVVRYGYGSMFAVKKPLQSESDAQTGPCAFVQKMQ